MRAPRDPSPGPCGSLNNGVRAAQSRSPNSLSDHQGIKLQMLRGMRGGMVPSQIGQNPPVSPTPLLFPPTGTLPTSPGPGPAPAKREGRPGPASKETW